MELKNKIAVVTGANKGIGHECVQQLLEKGAIVFG
ncbi:MAG: SDR family NAD(P)-dependent oxidoreductase, partial [Bacteroidota bacterium]